MEVGFGSQPPGPCSSVGNESACKTEDLGSNSWLGKIPLEKKTAKPTLVFLL